MKEKRAIGIELISGFYIFGGLVLLYTVFFTNLGIQKIDISTRLGVSWLPELYVRIGVALLSFIMAYGLLKFTKWGFWLFVTYNIYFLVVSSYLYKNTREQLFFGNLTWSIVMLIYTYTKRKQFLT